MVLIELLDGTREMKYGKALIDAFAEHAKYRELRLTSAPGSVDIPRYNLVIDAERGAYNPRRNQTHIMNLLDNLLGDSRISIAGRKSFTLIESDLYADGLNWCFGAVIPDTCYGKHLVLSTYRLNDPDLLAHVATHELGHMFGAASPGRRNTEENLGSHCTNLCIMQQKLSVPEMKVHARRLAYQQDKFCPDCAYELRRH
jgi:predicted Zn-dependent protease